VIDEEDLAILDRADEQARQEYGTRFGVYGNWDSMRTEAANAYLVSYDWPSTGGIARGTLCRRESFPDLEINGETFLVALRIDAIERITFSNKDSAVIRVAFHSYVAAGHTGEQEDLREYNFPISELKPYLPQ
jgi:hypothetical protein